MYKLAMILSAFSSLTTSGCSFKDSPYIHPYGEPEIVALPIVKGSKSYLDWIIAETQAKQ
jgi:uncharacterized protein involved in tolerance to divalent cations